MSETTNPGHRQRLRERFITGADGSRSEEALLELLLTYAIPQQDVRPLAEDLITRFGSLSAVLAASPEALCLIVGIKRSTAAMLKLVDWVRCQYASSPPGSREGGRSWLPAQPPLFELPGVSDPSEHNCEQPGLSSRQAEASVLQVETEIGATQPSERAPARRRSRSGLFGKAMLAEAIEMLPRLPNTESIEEVRLFLRDNLRFSAAETRRRNATYITQRMFPEGRADAALRDFARQYADRQELRDVAFYRFCKAEPLMFDVIETLLLPAIGSGRLDRGALRDFLVERFPGFKSIDDCASSIVDALVAAGVARADKQRISFSYREPPLPALAFVLHSELPEPGMYQISQVEDNASVRVLLWNPDRIVAGLYELRNLGLLSKVSQIDNFRQFTTKWDLGQVVAALVGQGGGG